MQSIFLTTVTMTSSSLIQKLVANLDFVVANHYLCSLLKINANYLCSLLKIFMLSFHSYNRIQTHYNAIFLKEK